MMDIEIDQETDNANNNIKKNISTIKPIKI